MEGLSHYHVSSPSGEYSMLFPDQQLLHRAHSRLALRDLNSNSALLSGAKRVPVELTKKPHGEKQIILKNHEKGNYMKPTESFKIAVEEVTPYRPGTGKRLTPSSASRTHTSPVRSIRQPQFVSPDNIAITPSEAQYPIFPVTPTSTSAWQQLRSLSPNPVMRAQTSRIVITPNRNQAENEVKTNTRSVSTPPGSSRPRIHPEREEDRVDQRLIRPTTPVASAAAGSIVSPAATKPRSLSAGHARPTVASLSRIPTVVSRRGQTTRVTTTITTTSQQKPVTPTRSASKANNQNGNSNTQHILFSPASALNRRPMEEDDEEADVDTSLSHSNMEILRHLDDAATELAPRATLGVSDGRKELGSVKRKETTQQYKIMHMGAQHRSRPPVALSFATVPMPVSASFGESTSIGITKENHVNTVDPTSPSQQPQQHVHSSSQPGAVKSKIPVSKITANKLSANKAAKQLALEKIKHGHATTSQSAARYTAPTQAAASRKKDIQNSHIPISSNAVTAPVNGVSAASRKAGASNVQSKPLITSNITTASNRRPPAGHKTHTNGQDGKGKHEPVRSQTRVVVEKQEENDAILRAVEACEQIADRMVDAELVRHLSPGKDVAPPRPPSSSFGGMAIMRMESLENRMLQSRGGAISPVEGSRMGVILDDDNVSFQESFDLSAVPLTQNHHLPVPTPPSLLPTVSTLRLLDVEGTAAENENETEDIDEDLSAIAPNTFASTHQLQMSTDQGMLSGLSSTSLRSCSPAIQQQVMLQNPGQNNVLRLSGSTATFGALTRSISGQYNPKDVNGNHSFLSEIGAEPTPILSGQNNSAGGLPMVSPRVTAVTVSSKRALINHHGVHRRSDSNTWAQELVEMISPVVDQVADEGTAIFPYAIGGDQASLSFSSASWDPTSSAASMVAISRQSSLQLDTSSNMYAGMYSISSVPTPRAMSATSSSMVLNTAMMLSSTSELDLNFSRSATPLGRTTPSHNLFASSMIPADLIATTASLATAAATEMPEVANPFSNNAYGTVAQPPPAMLKLLLNDENYQRMGQNLADKENRSPVAHTQPLSRARSSTSPRTPLAPLATTSGGLILTPLSPAHCPAPQNVIEEETRDDSIDEEVEAANEAYLNEYHQQSRDNYGNSTSYDIGANSFAVLYEENSLSLVYQGQRPHNVLSDGDEVSQTTPSQLQLSEFLEDESLQRAMMMNTSSSISQQQQQSNNVSSEAEAVGTVEQSSSSSSGQLTNFSGSPVHSSTVKSPTRQLQQLEQNKEIDIEEDAQEESASSLPPPRQLLNSSLELLKPSSANLAAQQQLFSTPLRTYSSSHSTTGGPQTFHHTPLGGRRTPATNFREFEKDSTVSAVAPTPLVHTLGPNKTMPAPLSLLHQSSSSFYHPTSPSARGLSVVSTEKKPFVDAFPSMLQSQEQVEEEEESSSVLVAPHHLQRSADQDGDEDVMRMGSFCAMPADETSRDIVNVDHEEIEDDNEEDEADQIRPPSLMPIPPSVLPPFHSQDEAGVNSTTRQRLRSALESAIPTASFAAQSGNGSSVYNQRLSLHKAGTALPPVPATVAVRAMAASATSWVDQSTISAASEGTHGSQSSASSAYSSSYDELNYYHRQHLFTQSNASFPPSNSYPAAAATELLSSSVSPARATSALAVTPSSKASQYREIHSPALGIAQPPVLSSSSSPKQKDAVAALRQQQQVPDDKSVMTSVLQESREHSSGNWDPVAWQLFLQEQHELLSSFNPDQTEMSIANAMHETEEGTEEYVDDFEAEEVSLTHSMELHRSDTNRAHYTVTRAVHHRDESESPAEVVSASPHSRFGRANSFCPVSQDNN